ncbi:hypothetical protein TpMuguga_01g00539 [Theileria parva strain Muguga]|uniref:SfiI-subtelomeric related protein family member n=1 Tax=Theileria parva TaxID=5875 RepID=Q4N8D2_THEPA|nr:uncharacterized protein TpMuguga_01g00539 [Theileria parva strain Muguga]EAN33776.1 hypothetical protein TpMuguga_01g00539 [Theileria parva strain Muguga]|eukprot:XP_766059.1 hypothetical protein [Theileria parva strain Muguga]
MKRCIINIKLLIYIILLQQWKALESLPTSSSSDKSPAPSNPSGGQSSTPRSQNQTSSSSTQSQLRTSTNNSTRTNSSVNQQNQSPKSPSQSQSQSQSSSSINSVTTPTGTRSDQSQVTKITVDIDKKSSTNELEYSKNDEIHKYAPKSGHVITKVTNGSAVIWESDDNVYSLRVALNDVSSNPEEHFLSVLDNNGALYLFQKSSDNSWKDVTEDRYCLFNLKFLTDNDEEIAKDKYSLCIYCFTYSCAFDKGSKCSKIKYDDQIIWNANDHTGFAPIKEVYLYMIPIKAFVRGNKDQYKKLELKKSAQPNETVDTVAKVTDASDTKSSPAPVATQSTPTRPTTRLTNVIVDIDKKQNSNEFDYSSDENYHTYTRKTGHSCSKVMQGTSLIWESQDNACGTLVRFKEQKLLVILLDNNTFKLFQHLSGKWTDITKDRYDVTKLKLLGEGDSVLNSSNYKINIVDLSFCYSLNQGIKCAAVKLGDDVVWKTGDDPKFQQIKTFFLGLASNNFYVKNMSDEIKKIDFKPTPATTPEAKQTTTATITPTTATTPATQTTAQPQSQTTARPRTQPQSPTTSQPRTQPQSPTTPTTQRPKSSEAESLEKYELPGLKLFTMNSSKKVVELGKSKYQITKDRDEHVYDLNDGVKCHEVKYQDKTVWKRESNSDKYPLYIAYKIDTGKFVITFEDGFIVFEFEDDKWKGKVHSLKQGEALPESKVMTAVKSAVLDLNDLQNTKMYDMVQTGNVRTFTPKEAGFFSGVIRTTGQDKAVWTVIWQIQGDFELANKISYEDFGKGKQILILDTRSGIKMLYKPNQNAYWKEVAEQPQNAFETIGAVTTQEEKVDMFELDILKPKSTKDCDYTEFDTEEQPKEEEKKQIENARKAWKKKDDVNQQRRPPTFKYQNYAAKPKKGISNIIDSDTIEKGEDDDDPGFDGSIWRQANLTQYATHICFRYTPKRCLAVLLSSGNFLLYEEDKNEDLNDITSKSRGEFFKLAFYTKEEDNKTYRKLKIEEITRSLLNLSYIFTFDNIECHRITHDNKTIWRHGVDSNFGTLKSVYFHLLDYKVSVENTSGEKKELDIQQVKNSKIDDSDPILQALKQTTGGSKEQKDSTTEPTPVIEDESETDIPEADLTSLNINDTSSSSKYQCSDNGIYKTFTAIHGHGFNKVTIPKTFGSDTIWESSGSDYAIKVRLKENSTGEKYMVLLLVSKKFKFFYSSGKNKPLADNTAGKKSFNNIKLFYKNETKCIYEELNPRLYTAALYHLSLGYKPKERVKFHLIKFGDKYVYSYDDNQGFGHMKGVYVDLVENNLYVVNTDDQTKEIDIEKGVLTQPTITPVKTKPEPPRVTTQPEKAKKTPVTPPETTPSEPETSPVPEAKASPVTAPPTTLITLNIDNTQSTSEFDYSKDENYHTYTPKDDHVFSKVTEKNAVIWEWKDTIYAKFARIRPKENEKYLAILLTNNSFKLFHQSHGKTWTDITKDKHDMTKLRFYGEGDAVLKSTHYTVSIVDLSFNYAFNEGVNCRKINYDDNVVWNHSDDKKFEFIKSFSLGLVSNKFFVKNNSGELKKIEYESEEVIEPEVTKEVSAPVTVEAKEPEPTEAEEPAKEASEPAKTTPIATAEPVLKPKPATNPATLDIEKTQSTADFEYSKNSNYHTYTPKSGHSFTKVTEKENVIWECKDGIPGTLVRKKKDEFFVILLQNNDFVLFQKTKKQPWTDITSQRHNVTALKFYGENDTELSTSDYLVTVFDFTYRVTFKDQNSCKKIKYGDDEIWKYKDNACKHFELGLVSNKFFVCNNERSQNNLNFKGPIIPRVPKTTPVEVTAATTVTQPKTSPPTITPTPATTDTTAPTPTTTSDTTSAQPKVTPPTPAPATTATTPEPAKPLPVDKSIVLDIETTTGTSQFEFSEANYIKTFNGKDDCVFDKVSEGPTVVWESEGVSGTMVRTKLFSNNDRFLVILLKNDTFMVFQKPSGGVWSEITGSRCDVKKLKFYGENDKEITAKDYKITLSDLSFSHMFKEGVKCEMVKMGEEVVWSHTDDKKFEDIMSFSLGLVSNKFFVKNRNGELKKLEPKPVVEPVLTKAESDKVTTTGPKPVVKPVKEEVKPPVLLTGQVTSAFHSKLKLYASDPVDSGKTVPLEFEVLDCMGIYIRPISYISIL